mgnify:CR=1 FL=1
MDRGAGKAPGPLVYLLFCVSKKGWGYDRYLEEANAGEGLKMPRWLWPYFVRAAFFRDQPKLSMALAWRFSKTAMTVEKLAKVMNRKNSVPHRRPPAMSKWMMLGLLGLIVVLAVHSLTLPGGMDGVKFYLLPDYIIKRQQPATQNQPWMCHLLPGF